MNLATELSGLLERIKAGDEDAATELVKNYEPEIRRFVRFRLTTSSVRRFVDSMDICQSVLVRFFRSLNNEEMLISDSRQLRALLLQIAQNRIYDVVAWQHAQKRDARRLDQQGDVALAGLADAQGSASQILEMQEMVELIYSKCSESERKLIDQRMNGRSWADLAQEFDSTEDALRKRMHRALERAAAEAGLLAKND